MQEQRYMKWIQIPNPFPPPSALPCYYNSNALTVDLIILSHIIFFSPQYLLFYMQFLFHINSICNNHRKT